MTLRPPFRTPYRLFVFLLPALLLLAAAPAAASPLSAQVAAAIADVLTRPEPLRLHLDREVVLDGDALPAFYGGRNYAPAWVDDRGPTPAAEKVLDLLRAADDEGLCPEDYHLPRIEPLLRLAADYWRYGLLFDPVYMARFDLLLTDAWVLYASHQLEGRVRASEVHPDWRSKPRRLDRARRLQQALAAGRPAAELAALAPPHEGYRRLRDEFQRLRRLSALGGWPTLPPGPVLRPGGSDPRLPLLRNRLLIAGDLPELPAVDGAHFDPPTVDALARFQSRHGLKPDGVLGEQTLEALNVPVERRIRQVELNLERWRWLPQDLGQRHIAVNIADFRLDVVEEGESVLGMAVVVGTGYRKTPVFSASLSYLIFAPYWNVPPTILREDKLPQIKAKPGYLRKHHFEIVRGEGANMVEIDPASIRWSTVTAANFPGVLRQKPGPWNPLGRVKFMLPNPFDVYLHDTPDKKLFGRDARTFSSGCIRLERAGELADYLLADQGWSRQTVRQAMAAGAPQQVSLKKPVPVHVLYWTSWVDGDGRLQLRPDIYQRDLDLAQALGWGPAGG